MIVEKPTHISGTLIDHIYIEKDFKDEYIFKSQRKPLYYSDHDTIIIVDVLTKDK